jgi:uncharacterized protein
VPRSTHRIGIISDTHGLLRPEAVAALTGCDLIIHAGDIGDSCTLKSLRAVAPVTAVRGNNDKGRWAARLPLTTTVKIGQLQVYVIHNVNDVAHGLTWQARAGLRAIISGHSHRPSIAKRDGVLFINPGSAGPRRFTLPVSLAILQVRGDTVDVTPVNLVENQQANLKTIIKQQNL